MAQPTDPTAASWLIALVAFLSPSPLALLKGSHPMATIETLAQLKTLLEEAQQAAKFALDLIPGGAKDDTAAILAVVEPAFKQGLAGLNLSPFWITAADHLLVFVVTKTVAAIEPDAA